MARGGPRQGTPGKAYAQRRDLHQPLRAVPDQPYGQAGQQIAAQKAVPLPAAPPTPTPYGNVGPVPNAEVGGGTQGPPMGLPGDFGAFDRPTERPNEHVTTGLNAPPVVAPPENPNVTALRAIYTQAPSNDLLKMIGLLNQ